MSHPFKRFAFTLAEKLGMTIDELYEKVDSHGLSEWMAFYLTKDEKWQEKYSHELQLKMSKAQSDEERSNAIRRLIGGRNKKGK